MAWTFRVVGKQTQLLMNGVYQASPFRPGFNLTQLNWSAPDQAISHICTYGDAPIPEDSVPLGMWNDDGWAVVFGDECVERWITAAE